MPGVKDTPHAGFTLSYNGVQFGGSDSEYKFILPAYSLNGTMMYDDAGRVVTHIQYILDVQACIYHDSEAAQSLQVDAVTRLLSEPGRVLDIRTLGLGAISRADLIWGPKPHSIALKPIAGTICSQLHWVLEFNVSPCESPNYTTWDTWMAWNYSVSCSFDFEGRETRTMHGYVQIPQSVVRISQPSPTPLPSTRHVVDEVRERITLYVPDNYRRVHSSFNENAAKNRLEFSVSDEALPGDAPMPGVSKASGSVDFGTDWPYVAGTTSLSMSLTSMPGASRFGAMRAFLMAVITQQEKLRRILKDTSSAVIPNRITLRQGLFDDARKMTGSVSWQIVSCAERFLKDSSLWEPVPAPDTKAWKDSVADAHLWHNRGYGGKGTRTIPNEDIVIDLCDARKAAGIGATSQATQSYEQSKLPFTCDPPEENSWLAYDLKVTLYRNDPQTWIGRTSPTISTDAVKGNTQGGDYAVNIPGPVYSNAVGDELPIVEQNGRPMSYVLMQFKGLRVKYLPVVPIIKTVGGHKVFQVHAANHAPTLAFELMDCPVYFVNTWIMYRFDGYVSSMKGAPNITTCIPAINKQNEDY